MSSGPPPAGAQYYPPPPSQQQAYPPPPNQQQQQQHYPPPPSQLPPQPGQAPQPAVSPQPVAAYQAEAPSAAMAKMSVSSPPPPGGQVGQAPGSVPAAQAFNDDNAKAMPGGAPGGGHFVGAGATVDDIGTFNGGSYRISHRDTNTVLTIQLAMGCPVTTRPGAMIAMTPTIQLRGSVNFSVKTMLKGGEIAHSQYVGPGELLLAPHTIGDITTLRLNGQEQWRVGKDAYLCCTEGIVQDLQRQGLKQAIMSGEGLYTYNMSGQGIVWIASFGAILRKDLQPGENYIVDNGHLVAWNCQYNMERVASGGIISSLSSGEGLVCKFTGPGTIFLQSRNPASFAHFLSAYLPRAGGERKGGGISLSTFM